MRLYHASAFVTPGSRLELIDDNGNVRSFTAAAKDWPAACVAVQVVQMSEVPLKARVVGGLIGEITMSDELSRERRA